MKKRTVLVQIVLVVALIVSATAIVTAAGPDRVRASADSQPPEPLVTELPPVPRGPMTKTQAANAVSILSFDDGSCESGLGAGTATLVTDLVDWDVPTQCVQSGLEIIGVTARMNTGQNIATFAFAQAGATPPAAGSVSTLPLTSIIAPAGACPATALSSRSISGSAVITDTANFFAGIQASGFAARDTNGASAGRIWLLCGTCGMTQYSPTDLTGLGLGGNWMIRVTVEDQNCVPVELMDFTIGG